MNQILQPAGFALQQRQDLVGLTHLPHVIPGRTQHLGAVPYQGNQNHDDRRVQRRDRQDAPADRHRAHQSNNTGTNLGGEPRRPFICFLPGYCQSPLTPPCEFVRSAQGSRDRVAPLLLQRFPFSALDADRGVSAELWRDRLRRQNSATNGRYCPRKLGRGCTQATIPL